MQKHISISQEKIDALEKIMFSQGQKFSPLVNVLIDNYLKEVSQN